MIYSASSEDWNMHPPCTECAQLSWRIGITYLVIQAHHCAPHKIGQNRFFFVLTDTIIRMKTTSMNFVAMQLKIVVKHRNPWIRAMCLWAVGTIGLPLTKEVIDVIRLWTITNAKDLYLQGYFVVERAHLARKVRKENLLCKVERNVGKGRYGITPTGSFSSFFKLLDCSQLVVILLLCHSNCRRFCKKPLFSSSDMEIFTSLTHIRSRSHKDDMGYTRLPNIKDPTAQMWYRSGPVTLATVTGIHIRGVTEKPSV